MYIAAVSLDLLLAAILAERGEPQDHHDLGRMATRVGVGLVDEQRATLGLFSDVLGRLGRYRAPGGEAARDGSGEEVGTVRVLERPGADGRRSPSFADYLALWDLLEREYRGAALPPSERTPSFVRLSSAPRRPHRPPAPARRVRGLAGMPVPPAPSARTDQGCPMTATRTVPEGGLRFVPGVYRYSAGVAAEPGLAGSVLAYVLSGAIRPQISATGPSRVYRAGESFFEPPGSEHLVSENAERHRTREPARRLRRRRRRPAHHVRPLIPTRPAREGTPT